MDDILEESRLKVSNFLKSACSNGEKVYFQPPENLKITYPCIVYKRSSIKHDHADDLIYRHSFYYEAVVISKTPDDPIFKNIINKILKDTIDVKTNYDRRIVMDNLYHDYFTIYT